jgi:hypothetical protein
MTHPCCSHIFDLLFSPHVSPRYPFTTHTSNISVRPTQWNMSYSPLFSVKMRQAMNHLVPLADLVALHLFWHLSASKIVFGASQLCSQNQPHDSGGRIGCNPAVGRALWGCQSKAERPDVFARSDQSAASWATRPPSGKTRNLMDSFNLGIGNESRRRH